MKKPNIVVLKTKFSNCEMCGSYDELWPYGKGKSWVCFSCGMKNEDVAKKNFIELIKNADIVIEALGIDEN